MNKFDKRFGQGFAKKKKGFPVETVLRLILYFSIMIAFLVLIVLLLNVFRVKNIQVEGNRVYSDGIISSVAGISEGQSMAKVTPKASADKLSDGLAFVKSAKIKKQLFSKVTIKVEEYPQPLYTKSGNLYYALSDKLEPLEKSTEAIDFSGLHGAFIQLPEFHPPVVGQSLIFGTYSEETTDQETYDGEKYEYIFDAVDAICSSGFAGNITHIDLSDKFDVWFIVDGKVKVILGNCYGLSDKLSLGYTVYSGEIYDGLAAAVINASDTDRILWRERPSVEDIMPSDTRPADIPEETEPEETVIAEG